MARFIAAFVATLTLLGAPAAFASQPTHPTHPTHPTTSISHRTDPAKPSVMFVLRGTLNSYTAATTTTDGTVTMTVASSNFEGKALTGTALTFSVTPKTRLVLHGLTTITSGDRGIVMVRAPKGSDLTALQASPAFGVIDQASSATDNAGKGSGDPATHTVMFVLRGTLSGYTAATPTTNGSISVTVASSNLERDGLKGQTLIFTVTPKTKMILHGLTTIAVNSRGIVKVRAPKGSVATALQTSPAFQVIDQASSK